MTLFEYMTKNNITKQELSESLGYSESAIMSFFRFEHPVREKFANLVQLYTNGQVKATELLKRSEQGMKKRAAYKAALKAGKSETATVCYGVCKMCNKKLNEIEL